MRAAGQEAHEVAYKKHLDAPAPKKSKDGPPSWGPNHKLEAQKHLVLQHGHAELAKGPNDEDTSVVRGNPKDG